MKERPIIFNADMVRAILGGRKTQERRPVKYDIAGRVRRARRCWHPEDPNAFNACPHGMPGDRLWVLNMPRWASRITLEITAVRVERVQDITEGDAKSEGFQRDFKPDESLGWGAGLVEARYMFAEVWQSIYGTWDANPWVWVIEFRRIQP